MYYLEPFFHTFLIGIAQFKAYPKPIACLHRFYPYGLTSQLEVFFPIVHGHGDIELTALWYKLWYIDLQSAHRNINGFTSDNRISGFTSAAPADDFNKYCFYDLDTLMFAFIYMVFHREIKLHRHECVRHYRKTGCLHVEYHDIQDLLSVNSANLLSEGGITVGREAVSLW